MVAYQRVAYLRLKVHLTKYKETTRSTSGDLRAVVFAVLDGVEVYADSRKLKPMYMGTNTTKRSIRFAPGGIRVDKNAPRMPKRALGSSDIISFGSSSPKEAGPDDAANPAGDEPVDSDGYGGNPGPSPSPDPPAQ
jgi:hypothetical protein